MKVKTILGLMCLVWFACESSQISREYPASVTFRARNSAEVARADEAIGITRDRIQEFAPDFNPQAFVVFDGENELASQADDVSGDDRADRLTFVADFSPREMKPITVRYAPSGDKPRRYPKRTQAELSHKFDGEWQDREYVDGSFRNVDYVRVPDEHTDHSFFFRYEGPGWESDKVGYRFYLDWRNAIDIFGKKVPDLVLQDVGQDGFDSYHEMADWGMDVLKVGESLGIGSIGMWRDGEVFRVSKTDSVTCEIVANGPVYSHIRTTYYGWQVGADKYDLTSNLSITAGSRLTKHDVEVTGSPANLCTGLVKHEAAETLTSEGQTGEWAYLALYGKQSLADDNLGMAILYRRSDLIETTEDNQSQVLLLKPVQGKLTYYFAAAWEKEPNGLKTQEAFRQYLQEVIARLNAPVAIEFTDRKS